MKAHIETDAKSDLVHSAGTTTANERDVTQALKLVHGKKMLSSVTLATVVVLRNESNSSLRRTLSSRQNLSGLNLSLSL